MELTYRLTREDYRQFVKLAEARVASHAKGPLGLGLKAATVLFLLASVLLTLFVLDYLFRSQVIDDRAFVAACLAYAWALFSVQLCGWFWHRQSWAHWAAGESVWLGELHLKVDGDGAEVSDQTKITKYSWRAFNDISEHRDLIILWMDRALGTLVHSRAFANEETRRMFVSLARERIAPS